VKRIITVLRKDVADEISDETGSSYMIQALNGEEVYSFVLTDRLHKLLNEKQRFSRRDWFIDSRLRF